MFRRIRRLFKKCRLYIILFYLFIKGLIFRRKRINIRITPKSYPSLPKIPILLIIFMVVFLIFLVIIFSFYYLYSDRISFRLSDLSERIAYKININPTVLFYNIESKLNIFRPKKDLLDGILSVYNLKLSKNDLQHFEKILKEFIKRGYRDKDINTWRNAKLNVEGKDYDIKVKISGDNKNHWDGEQVSYKIKILNNESINHIKDFNLMIFEDKILTGRMHRILSQKLDLFDIRDDFIVLKINGRIVGLYYLREKINKDFLEYNQCSNCIVIRSLDTQYKDHPECGFINKNLSCWQPYGVTYLRNHLLPFDCEIGKTYLEKSDINQKKTFYFIYNLFQTVKQENIQKIPHYFDMAYLINYEIFRMLVRNKAAGDNIFLAYKATNSKIYPIAKLEIFNNLLLNRGGFEKSINTQPLKEREPRTLPYIENQKETIDETIELFGLITRNDEIRKLKYKKAYEFIRENEKELLDAIEKEAEKYRPYANANRYNFIGVKTIENRILSYKGILKYNMDLIKNVLEFSKVYINIIAKDNKIKVEILPDSIAQIGFDKFKINLTNEFSGSIILNYPEENITKSTYITKSEIVDVTNLIKDLSFFAGLDEEFNPEKRQYNLEIIFSDKISIENIEIKMENLVTKRKIPKEDIYFQIADGNGFYENLAYITPEEFVLSNTEWEYKNNRLNLYEGEYHVNQDIIIPKDTMVNIHEGAKILIAKDKSIVSYSPINILGTKQSPVIITSLDKEKPFGSLGIIEADANINWLDLSNGNEAYINGIYLSGGLSIYHSVLNLKNTKIHNNHADDGLIVKYSKVNIKDSTFTQNFADQVDLDFCQGTIENSEFSNSKDKINGDGIDLSGSDIIIINNKFKNLGDKGISIGEETTATVYQNEISENNYGIAVKDSSTAYILFNNIINNNLALVAYQKKQTFNGGYIYTYKNNLVSNNNETKLDKLSELKELKQIEAENIINNIEK